VLLPQMQYEEERQAFTPVNMKLARQPRRPRYVPYISLTKYLLGRKNEVWRDYLPVFADLSD